MKIALRRSRKGFTLVEVVVSILIVTIVSVGFLVMFTSAYSGFFMLGSRTRAVNEAQSLIETYYTSPASIDTATWKLVTADMTEALLTDPANTGYTHFYKLTSETHNSVPIERITVLVFFKNNTKSVTISSLVS